MRQGGGSGGELHGGDLAACPPNPKDREHSSGEEEATQEHIDVVPTGAQERRDGVRSSSTEETTNMAGRLFTLSK